MERNNKDQGQYQWDQDQKVGSLKRLTRSTNP
jgi:hypothetical protein